MVDAKEDKGLVKSRDVTTVTFHGYFPFLCLKPPLACVFRLVTARGAWLAARAVITHIRRASPVVSELPVNPSYMSDFAADQRFFLVRWIDLSREAHAVLRKN